MGGDDLGSEDEYLFDAGLIDSAGGQRGTVLSSDDEDGSVSSDDDGREPRPSKKRKGAGGAATDDPASNSSSGKRKKDRVPPTSSKNLLIRAARGIAMDDADAQATFLETLYSHSSKMSGGAAGGDNADGEGADEKRPPTEAFPFRTHVYSAAEGASEETRRFRHSDLAAFLKSGPLPSTKRLKNWKHPHSPMVVVVTLSARRSVELMKQLSSLKLPIAKLFAKHMGVEDQAALLRGDGKPGGGGGGIAGGGGEGRKNKKRFYSLAVGTPGRLLRLLRHGREEPGSGGLGALRMKHTELIILDCHEDSKGWTVCTLKDTSKELMEFMKEGVVPELEKRKGKIKLAMF